MTLDPRVQPIEDDDLHSNESEGLAERWYNDPDDPHEPDDELEDIPDDPRM